MRLGVIGRGPWGDTYARTLNSMGVEFWRAGRDWKISQHPFKPDGVIIASVAESHFEIAGLLMFDHIPVLIEKPMCMNSDEAGALLLLGKGIVFTGYTRLYSPAWREFKAKVLSREVKSVYAVAGSADCKLSPQWDWGGHLVAMCLDLGFDPLAAKIVTGREEHPLTVIVNGDISYIDRPEDRPRPLEVLLTEFMAAIEKGEPDIRGLELGVKVVEAIEKIEQREEVTHGA